MREPKSSSGKTEKIHENSLASWSAVASPRDTAFDTLLQVYKSIVRSTSASRFTPLRFVGRVPSRRAIFHSKFLSPLPYLLLPTKNPSNPNKNALFTLRQASFPVAFPIPKIGARTIRRSSPDASGL